MYSVNNINNFLNIERKSSKMKKLVVMCMAVVMMLSMSITSFAAFVSSPTGNPAPKIISFFAESDDCDAELIITPYSKRDTLHDTAEDALENAYNELKASGDLTALNADLASLAKKLGIKGTELAVSDLFDATWVGCSPEDHSAEKHGIFTIELEADSLKNFVGLLHYYNGEWELIDNAKVKGNILTFKADNFSPFAIVVDTNPEKTPNSGDMSFIWLWVIVAVVSGTVLVVLIKKANKKA